MTSVAEPHHFCAAPAPGKNFAAAPAPAVPALAPAPTLLYSKAKFSKRTKFWIHVETTVLYLVHVILYDLLYVAENINWMGYKLLHF
jgi:hypothetical protein